MTPPLEVSDDSTIVSSDTSTLGVSDTPYVESSVCIWIVRQKLQSGREGEEAHPHFPLAHRIIIRYNVPRSAGRWLWSLDGGTDRLPCVAVSNRSFRVWDSAKSKASETSLVTTQRRSTAFVQFASFDVSLQVHPRHLLLMCRERCLVSNTAPMSEIEETRQVALFAPRVLPGKVTGAGEKQVDVISKSGNIVHTFNVESFADYLKVVSGFQQMALAEARDDGHPLLLFRGHKANRVLKASIDGFGNPKKTIHIDREMFRRFKENCTFPQTYNDWDMLSFARHFSLPSRFLDWSSNSLVALWFAIHHYDQNYDQKSSRYTINTAAGSDVWVLKTTMLDFVDIDKQDDPFPTANGKTCFFKPTELEFRIKNQNSFMMRQVYEYKDPQGPRTRRPEDMEIKAVDQNPIYRNRLWKISLAQHAFEEMDNRLQSYGITEDYLFPKSVLFNYTEIATIVKTVEEEFKATSVHEGGDDESK